MLSFEFGKLKPQNLKLKPQNSNLTIAVAEALASMGATEDDAALLRGATRAISEIDVNQRKT